MIKSSFEKYLEAIKSLKKKAKDTHQLFLTEKADFENFKENIKTEMKSFLEKVLLIFINLTFFKIGKKFIFREN